MNPDELDRVLLREAEIIPSSGFARSVMAAVRSEAAVPPPIPFPWKRALPGLAACAVAIVWVSKESASSATVFTPTLTQWTGGILSALGEANAIAAGWALVGLLLTVAGLKLTWELKRRG